MRSDTMKAQSEAKWTAGQWEAIPCPSEDHDRDPLGVYQLNFSADLERRYLLSNNFEPGSDEEEDYLDYIWAENAANANLISCAPALVEALEACLHLAETPGDFTAAERLNVLSDCALIIAKAKGEA